MFVDSQARRKDAKNTATVDNYFLVNAKLGYSVQTLIPGIDGEIYLAVENLTDTDYEYLPGYPMPGTTGMLGFRLVF
jgi:iron complex outermembrane receptor protein